MVFLNLGLRLCLSVRSNAPNFLADSAPVWEVSFPFAFQRFAKLSLKGFGVFFRIIKELSNQDKDEPSPLILLLKPKFQLSDAAILFSDLGICQSHF